MNDRQLQFEAWADSARREFPPAGDVAARTLAAIRIRKAEQRAARPMAVFTAAYCGICIAALAAGYLSFGLQTDPMSSFFAIASGIAP